MLSKSDNIEFMISDNVDEVIEEIFGLLLNGYQIGSETSMRDCHFVFDYVHSFYWKFQKISSNRGESSKDYPNKIKKQKSNHKYYQ